MKKLELLITGLLILVFSACSDDNATSDVGTPGNIPGMGNAGGELEISEPFVLPEGVTVLSISGVDNPDPAADIAAAAMKSTSCGDDDHDDEGETQDLYYLPAIGSGGEWIALNLLLEVADGVNKDIIIPAGMLVKCEQDGYQNGIVLQDVRIHLAGCKNIQIKLFVYCINKGKTGSTKQLTYVFKGITQCELFTALTAALEYKKIDISDFSEDELEDYEYITTGLQDIVWAITNGRGANHKDWAFIEALKDIIEDAEDD